MFYLLEIKIKIQSAYKDYYDYVAHAYGGGDPKVLYERKRLAPLRQGNVFAYSDTLQLKQKDLPQLPYHDTCYKLGFERKWLAIAGKLYLIVRQHEPGVFHEWQVLNETQHSALWATLHRKQFNWDRTEVKFLEVEHPSVTELSRTLNAPVFTFTDKSWRDRDAADVDGDIPILGKLGVPAIISAEQVYQDIAYFIGNTMHGSPDLMPPTVMTDKEKIVGHGFDIKQSFRHRK